MADVEALGLDALAEYEDVRAILVDIPADDWERPTPAAGWTVRARAPLYEPGARWFRTSGT